MTPKLQRPAARLFWTGIGRNPSGSTPRGRLCRGRRGARLGEARGFWVRRALEQRDAGSPVAAGGHDGS